MDLTTLTDEGLSDHLNAVLAEQERRAALVQIPEQITELHARFVACGGDPADLP
ncbi:hypothetical protein [Zhihengliuella halotolerans]|uniref:Uncharacterized protein n=1 Tax=Zhihengliuella halotolerans TaxID=370736 RepID=A0A4Q8AD98_9MICC|nr:hypothetical protein [Zhihengliuella halotolerans]RZU61731.1 hypothetical protein EV380_1309 [Zhihengliuella halotolerans]